MVWDDELQSGALAAEIMRRFTRIQATAVAGQRSVMTCRNRRKIIRIQIKNSMIFLYLRGSRV
jgi:hypothetical protein